jgi:hypothetical protein
MPSRCEQGSAEFLELRTRIIRDLEMHVPQPGLRESGVPASVRALTAKVGYELLGPDGR